jgi:hypothetical protein
LLTKVREGAWKKKNASDKHTDDKEVPSSTQTYQAVAIYEIMWVRSLIGGQGVISTQDAAADA